MLPSFDNGAGKEPEVFAEDGQIDAILLDDDSSTIYIIQVKFAAGALIDTESLRAALSSWIHVSDMFRLLEPGPGHKTKQ